MGNVEPKGFEELVHNCGRLSQDIVERALRAAEGIAELAQKHGLSG